METVRERMAEYLISYTMISIHKNWDRTFHNFVFQSIPNTYITPYALYMQGMPKDTGHDNILSTRDGETLHAGLFH
jgi:hypothetical protein